MRLGLPKTVKRVAGKVTGTSSLKGTQTHGSNYPKARRQLMSLSHVSVCFGFFGLFPSEEVSQTVREEDCPTRGPPTTHSELHSLDFFQSRTRDDRAA